MKLFKALFAGLVCCGLTQPATAQSLLLDRQENLFLKHLPSALTDKDTGDYEDLTHLDLDALLSMETTPPSIMTSHVHLKGETMVGYQYMFMNMSGNINGTQPVSVDKILETFSVAPKDMTMQMHMLHAMYAPTDDMTFMLMLPYNVIWMNMEDGESRKDFQHLTHGLGDTVLEGNFVVYRDDINYISVLGGMSLPTGDIGVKDSAPPPEAGVHIHNPDLRLPYPMRMGSGTFDLKPGLSYSGHIDSFGWGAHALGTYRLGQNSANYRMGHNVSGDVWLSYKLLDWLSPSFRIKTSFQQNYEGHDDDLLRSRAPTADPLRQGGLRVDAIASLNFFAPEGVFKGQSVGVDLLVPLMQSLSGPQMPTLWTVNGGYQWTF